MATLPSPPIPLACLPTSPHPALCPPCTPRGWCSARATRGSATRPRCRPPPPSPWRRTSTSAQRGSAARLRHGPGPLSPPPAGPIERRRIEGGSRARTRASVASSRGPVRGGRNRKGGSYTPALSITLCSPLAPLAPLSPTCRGTQYSSGVCPPPSPLPHPTLHNPCASAPFPPPHLLCCILCSQLHGEDGLLQRHAHIPVQPARHQVASLDGGSEVHVGEGAHVWRG